MRSMLHTIVPLIPAGADVAAEVTFFVDYLGFKVLWQNENMASVARDGICFNLIQNTTEAWAENASFSIGVSDLSALYQEYQHAPARVGSLERKPWGRREFHMIIPSGVCLQFYEIEAS